MKKKKSKSKTKVTSDECQLSQVKMRIKNKTQATSAEEEEVKNKTQETSDECQLTQHLDEEAEEEEGGNGIKKLRVRERYRQRR